MKNPLLAFRYRHKMIVKGGAWNVRYGHARLSTNLMLEYKEWRYEFAGFRLFRTSERS
jgi:hypothetical protein